VTTGKEGTLSFRSICLLALIAVTGLAACSGDDGSRVIEGESVTVRMFDSRFEFEEIRVPVGGTVTFVGSSNLPHNAVASDGSWSTESDFGSLEQYNGDTSTLRFDAAGTYVFYCTFHGNNQGAGMSGTLVVGD
jgi:plastocyanin